MKMRGKPHRHTHPSNSKIGPRSGTFFGLHGISASQPTPPHRISATWIAHSLPISCLRTHEAAIFCKSSRWPRVCLWGRPPFRQPGKQRRTLLNDDPGCLPPRNFCVRCDLYLAPWHSRSRCSSRGRRFLAVLSALAANLEALASVSEFGSWVRGCTIRGQGAYAWVEQDWNTTTFVNQCANVTSFFFEKCEQR